MASRIASILIFLLCTINSNAQPTLPDITGSLLDKGIVAVTWNCQYEGVKGITVYRSADSNGNYFMIGYMDKLRKGAQEFMDKHPMHGNNFYRLSIRFKSGLVWGSNRFGIYVPDSMHHVRAAESAEDKETSLPRPATRTTTRTENVTNNLSGKKNTPAPSIGTHNLVDTTTLKKNAVSMSFTPDTTTIAKSPVLESANMPVIRHQKIAISYDDPYENSATLIRSRFIFVDPVSGHINITLPEDVHAHHYSIKFYDQKNKMVVEVPRVNTASIIMDRRNFQHKGYYKFVIRKDAVELETGYININ